MIFFILSVFIPGPNKVAFLVSNYNPNRHSAAVSSEKPSPPGSRGEQLLLPPPLRDRLTLQPALVRYLERSQVLAWVDEPLARHAERLMEIARLEPNPQGLFQNFCSVM